MLKQQRQNEILKLLEKKNYMTIIELSKKLNVSDMTIRRDVTELEEDNKLLKLYGGAQKITKKETELSTEGKINLHIEEKEYIGTIMNSLINDFDVVYLGAGTTIFYALPFIKKKEIKIITNSLISFNYLVKHTEYEAQLTGGEFSRITEEFVGPHAESIFENLNIDISFAATNGIYRNNVTSSNSMKGSIQNSALHHSKKKIVVADSTKFNVSDVYTFCNLTSLDYLVTDNKIKRETLTSYSEFTHILTKPIR